MYNKHITYNIYIYNYNILNLLIDLIHLTANTSRSLPMHKIEDDHISECTLDILNEATFNTAAFGAYDVNDDVTRDRADSADRYHTVRRGSIGSDSVRSESTQGTPCLYLLASGLVE